MHSEKKRNIGVRIMRIKSMRFGVWLRPTTTRNGNKMDLENEEIQKKRRDEGM